jgi:hypothetical protein
MASVSSFAKVAALLLTKLAAWWRGWVTKTISVLLALVGCLVARPSLADDVLDALAVLSDGVKCSIPPSIEGANPSLFYHQVNTFSGNRTVFQTDTEQRFGNGYVQKERDTVKFSSLDPSEIGEFSPPTVLYSCSKKVACISVRQETGLRRTDSSGITVCDKEIAKYIKLAIDTLIKWNKEHDASGATGEAMPSAKPHTSSDPFSGVPLLLGHTQKTSPFSGVPLLLGPR